VYNFSFSIISIKVIYPANSRKYNRGKEKEVRLRLNKCVGEGTETDKQCENSRNDRVDIPAGGRGQGPSERRGSDV
jgi:hypothetical protein